MDMNVVDLDDLLDVINNDNDFQEFQRFAVFNEEELESEINSRIPKTTQSKIDWAIRLFKEWLVQWRTRLDGQKVLKDIDEFCHSDLNFCLRYFFAEVRKKMVLCIHLKH